MFRLFNCVVVASFFISFLHTTNLYADQRLFDCYRQKLSQKPKKKPYSDLVILNYHLRLTKGVDKPFPVKTDGYITIQIPPHIDNKNVLHRAYFNVFYLQNKIQGCYGSYVTWAEGSDYGIIKGHHWHHADNIDYCFRVGLYIEQLRSGSETIAMPEICGK